MVNRKWWVGMLALVFAAGTAFAQEDSDKPKQDEPKPQDEAKKKRDKKARAPFGLPSVKDLKEKLELDDEVATKIEAIYKDTLKKFGELRKKAKAGGDRKALGKEVRALRTGIVAKINECLNEEQQKKFKELVPQRGKKKKTDKKPDTNTDKKQDE